MPEKQTNIIVSHCASMTAAYQHIYVRAEFKMLLKKISTCVNTVILFSCKLDHKSLLVNTT